jgi:hypothetical protein
MYLNVKKLKLQFRKIPEVQDIGAIADTVNKMSNLLFLIMGDPFINAEIKKIPREDWEWFSNMIMDYHEPDNEFWEIVMFATKHQERVDFLERTLSSLPSMEVSEYV